MNEPRLTKASLDAAGIVAFFRPRDVLLRFATKEEAEANVRDLAMRWFLVRETRVVESDDPVNYAWVDGRWVKVKPNRVWVPGEWKQVGSYWAWTPGRWEKVKPAQPKPEGQPKKK